MLSTITEHGKLGLASKTIDGRGPSVGREFGEEAFSRKYGFDFEYGGQLDSCASCVQVPR